MSKKNLDIQQKIRMSNKKNSDVKKLGIKHNKKSRSSQQDQDVYKEKSGCTATKKYGCPTPSKLFL